VFGKIIGPRMGVPSNPNSFKSLEKQVEKALDSIENIWLKDKPFLAGSEITLADLSLACELAQLTLLDYDLSSRPRLSAWLKKMKEVPGFEQLNEFLYKVKAKL